MVSALIFKISLITLCLLSLVSAAEQDVVPSQNSTITQEEKPDCSNGVPITPEQTAMLVEMKHTQQLIDLYEKRVKFLRESIADANRTETRVKEMDFEYLLNLFESETVKTPSNKMLQQVDGAELLRTQYAPDFDVTKVDTKPQTLHEMLKIAEMEKIVWFDYVNIKPIGMNAAAGRSRNQDGVNKGHIVNAGVLYVLESGLLKVLSTTGALLLEKNIGFDVSPIGNIQDSLTSIVSSPNPEDMFIAALTKQGKIYHYSIELEKQFDPSTIMRNNTEEGSAEKATSPKLTPEERRELRSAQQQPVNYEYIFNDADFSTYDLDDLIAKKTGVTSNGDHRYSDLIIFAAQGRMHLVFVQDGKNLVFYQSKKDQIHVVEMRPGIKKIQRYSAFVMVQYDSYVEFVLFDQHELLDTVSKISMNGNIVSIQSDVSQQRFVFVQTETQIHIYDCDPVMQQQYNQINLIHQQIKGCQFLRKAFSSRSQTQRKIKSFQAVTNALMVFFEDGTLEFLYIRDLLQSITARNAGAQLLMQELRVMPVAQPQYDAALINDFSHLAHAKTASTTLFLHKAQKESEHLLVLSQYMPLPAYKSPAAAAGDYDELFSNLRTPMFFLVFIAVLLVQICWKKSKFNSDRSAAEAKMGPLEKSLAGKGPGGRLNAKQLNEVRELDGMLGGMGSMADGMMGDLSSQLGGMGGKKQR